MFNASITFTFCLNECVFLNKCYLDGREGNFETKGVTCVTEIRVVGAVTSHVFHQQVKNVEIALSSGRTAYTTLF